MHNINSGRLRDYVKVYSVTNAQDATGELTNSYNFEFDARADVKVRSGSQSAEFGTVVTSRIITVLMRYDDRLLPDMVIEWQGNIHKVLHSQPHDTVSMVATCEVIT